MPARGADVLVKGGLLVSGQGVQRADVVVRNGKVTEVGPDLAGRQAVRVIDARGTYVLPGAIDAHAHPVYGDKMDSFSICAAFGGVTTLIPFIGNISAWGYSGYTPEVVHKFIEDSERISYLDFAVHAAFVAADDAERAVPELINMGVLSFKMFMAYPRRGMMMADAKMLQVMAAAAPRGGLAMVHAENGYCIDHLMDRFAAEGKTSPEYFLRAQPNILEAEAFYRAATYAGVTGCPLYGVHLSAREVLPVLRLMRGQGSTLFAETCPHYLTLTNDEVLAKGALGKVGPPLREQADVEAMWTALMDGTLDTVGSDSTGLTVAQKRTGGQSTTLSLERGDAIASMVNIFDARYGLNTIQHMVPVVFSEGVQKGRISLPRLVQVFCENPAKIFGLYPRKGTLEVGSDADLVLWDPARTEVASAKQMKGNGDFCSFEGFQLQGMPVLTMQRGEVIVEGGKLMGRQGRARFLPGDANKAAYASGGHRVR